MKMCYNSKLLKKCIKIFWFNWKRTVREALITNNTSVFMLVQPFIRLANKKGYEGGHNYAKNKVRKCYFHNRHGVRHGLRTGLL